MQCKVGTKGISPLLTGLTYFIQVDIVMLPKEPFPLCNLLRPGMLLLLLRGLCQVREAHSSGFDPISYYVSYSLQG